MSAVVKHLTSSMRTLWPRSNHEIPGKYRTLFTPHLGSAVDSVRRDIAMVAAENILVGLLGKPQAKVVGCF